MMAEASGIVDRRGVIAQRRLAIVVRMRIGQQACLQQEERRAWNIATALHADDWPISAYGAGATHACLQ